jgi:hypothetical protein
MFLGGGWAESISVTDAKRAHTQAAYPPPFYGLTFPATSGYWIDNWIYWITHSYTQLQCIHFTLAVHYSTCRVFLQLKMTLTNESLQGPGPPGDPAGSYWPSTNTSVF